MCCAPPASKAVTPSSCSPTCCGHRGRSWPAWPSPAPIGIRRPPGGQVADEPKAATRQKLRNLGRIQAERPRLTPAPDASDPAARLREPGIIARKHGPVDVGEHQQAAGGGKAVYGAQRLVDGIGCQVVGHAFPHKQARRAVPVPSAPQCPSQVIAFEVDRHEPHVPGQRVPSHDACQDAAKDFSLGLLGRRVIDLEHGHLRKARQPIGAAVEAGPEDDELADPGARVAYEVVDQAGPRHRRGARARARHPVVEHLDRTPDRTHAACPYDQPPPPGYKVLGEGVAKQPRRSQPCRLERSLHRHQLGCSA